MKGSNKYDYELIDLLKWYSENGKIDLDDLFILGKEECMNKVLKEVHKYNIYQTKDGRWRTYIDDATNLHGRKAIVKTNKNDLLRFLLDHYHCKPCYTMN